MTQPDPGRRSRILLGASGPVANVSIAVVSTIVFLVVVTLAIVNSPGWETVKASFFNASEARETFPLVASAFLLNVKMFLIAEVFILAFALLIAILRGLPGPVFFPLRALAIVYTDLFRGVPTILVVYLLGFGMPGLNLTGIPTSPVFWGTVSLVLVYSAYVSEVYRAGLSSIHPSQSAAARSLGLSYVQTLRTVLVPQAVRRVIPPLLNDFISLQKDTALLSVAAIPEALLVAGLWESKLFNLSPITLVAALFIVITIPQARVVDWLIDRDASRRAGGS